MDTQPLLNLPEEMLQAKRWTLCNTSKVPLALNGSNRVGSWYDTADTMRDVVKVLEAHPGSALRAGFVFASDRQFVGIDLDKVLNKETGDIVPWAREVLERVGGCVEESQSGTGLHIYTRGPKPEGFERTSVRGLEDYAGGRGAGIEVYDHGRYFVVTGKPVSKARGLGDRGALEWIRARFFAAPGELDGNRKFTREERDQFEREGVPEGQRNNVLTSLVGHWIHREPSERLLLLKALEWNDKNRPPLEEDEVRETVQSVARKHRRNNGDTKARCVFQSLEDVAEAAEGLPVVNLEPGRLADAAKQAQDALTQATGLPVVYQRGGRLVRVARLPEVSSVRQGATLGAHAPQLLEVPPVWLAAELEKVATFCRPARNGKGWLTTDCPPKLGQLVIENAGAWPFHGLQAIQSSPVLLEDGRVLQQEGFDAGSGLLLDFGGARFPAIPESPSLEDARRAVRQLLEPVELYNWANEHDRSVWLAAALTAVVRPTLPSAPAFLFDAPQRGSGKTLAMRLVAMLAAGGDPAVMLPETKDEEMRKRLIALLLRGAQVIAIDNLDAPLDSAALCVALTSPVLEDRILGATKTCTVSTAATFLASGNNVCVRGDLQRRVLVCRIDPRCERPEERKFPFNPVDRLRMERPRFVAAALTLLRAHHLARSPDTGPVLGGFEAWCRRIAAAIAWVGEPDPREGRIQDDNKDAVDVAFEQLLRAWHEQHGTAELTLRDLHRTAGEPLLEAFGGLAEAFEEHSDPRGREGHGGLLRRLGQLCGHMRGRTFDGFRLERAGGRKVARLGGGKRWRVEVV